VSTRKRVRACHEFSFLTISKRRNSKEADANYVLASHADILRGSSRVLAPRSWGRNDCVTNP